MSVSIIETGDRARACVRRHGLCPSSGAEGGDDADSLG